jgi:hypothetical protein
MRPGVQGVQLEFHLRKQQMPCTDDGMLAMETMEGFRDSDMWYRSWMGETELLGLWHSHVITSPTE